ncbi:hypothetical protein VT84_32330 [Gemmata sp. SH-PL17]|uniref:hypothetical protein n=1 Tax=Gemmata sp. SH-PL17 TaxID=1630693 RepID=UPI00078BF1C1|nr:hypothetical protein [Gemmata sp. SH-PL17]AMV29127.1 hypothetical protein VT84_32330 [Gemmata sp. SH-PL17]
MRTRLQRLGRGAALALPLALAACQTLIKPPEPCGDTGGLTPACHKDPTLEAVASDIDHIEKHIDLWGSITTKHPDVWGSARMTKYQQDVETIFALELKNPAKIDEKVTAFQGARARADQAFLAQAVAINAAFSGRQAALLDPNPVTVVTGTRTLTSNSTGDSTGTVGIGNSTDNEAGKDPVVKNNQKSSTDTTSKANTGDDLKQTFNTAVPKTVEIPKGATIPSDFRTFVDSKMDVTRTVPRLPELPGFTGPTGLQLEPTIILDEKKRFLDHLNQIRRVNEGDDTADSPGYALYLVRVPVSVLPGKRTDSGHGAEIMMSVKPIIGDDLLPSTFRSLVTNDMVDQFSELMTVALNSDRESLIAALGDKAGISADKVAAAREKYPKATEKEYLQKMVSRVRPKYTAARPSRHAEYAFPMNHLEELFGETFVQSLVVAAMAHYRVELERDQVIHLHDTRAAVREQVVAGYRFLTTANPHTWALCTHDLARAVRDVNGTTGGTTIAHYRAQYDKMLARESGGQKSIESDRLAIKALGWAVLLESALLNDQLVRDIKETMTHKGAVPTAEGWQDYFHPEPSPTARRAFNDYVACRWPMYTFAVDPVTEQQNVQDTLSQRRELQLALSLAFASGNISAESFTRFARRLEADYQTIDLNRTVVGFSHGDNTFGWRFYPRFQTPEIPGNLTVLTRDLIGGKAFSKRQEVHQRRLEPGQRECVALVIMPSFVPFAEINVSSSWFNLNDPKHKSHSTKEAVQLSRRLHAIETVCPKGDLERYQAGELNRLQAKAKMLSARLPLQDMKFPVPYENTLGGFEFFNSGITDLAPQLRGWYGAAGYEGKAVELFLMGDNFSVVNTNIIAGGKQVTPRLISRQVVSVTIPENAAVSEDKAGLYSESGKFIDVRLATPYGVGGPLRIPVLGPPPEPAPAPKNPVPPVLNKIGDKQTVVLERDTDLVLTGTDFTADTRVFAGGKTCVAEVLSRTVVKVTVPKTIVPLRKDGKLYVEVKVATPYGASDPIEVPVVQIPAPPVMATPKPPAAFSAPTLTVAFRYKNLGIEAVEEPNRRPELTIAVTDPDAINLLQGKGTATIELKADGIGTISLDNVAYNAEGKQLSGFSLALMTKIVGTCAAQFGPENVNPPVPIKFASAIKVDGKALEIANGLTVNWVRVPTEKK